MYIVRNFVLQKILKMSLTQECKTLTNLNNELNEMLKSLHEDIYKLSAMYVTTPDKKNDQEIKKEIEKLKGENEGFKKKVESLSKTLVNLMKENGTKEEYLKQFSSSVISDETETNKASINGEVKKSETKLNKTENNNKSVQDKDSPESKPTNNASESEQKIHFGRLDVRVGQIISVEKHPNADSLYIEKVDFGNGTIKTVVSGLVQHVPIEEMLNRKGVFLCNLKPTKKRGVLSEAMLLCAVNETKTEIIEPPEQAVPGDIVTCQAFERNPDPILNPKKKIFETVVTELRINEGGVATYRNIPLVVPWKGVMKAPTLTEAKIA